jgi:hypothetical protein
MEFKMPEPKHHQRDPALEMIPYRADPGTPDTDRAADAPAEVWPAPNPGPATSSTPVIPPSVDDATETLDE